MDRGQIIQRLRRLARIAVYCVFAAILCFLILWLAFPFPRAKLQEARRRASTVVYDRDGRPLRGFLGADDCRLWWRDIGQIDRRLILATLAVEDERFFSHPGVDPVSVVRATRSNIAAGRVVSGASTITMQCVRLLTPRPRTFPVKALEAFRALQLEGILTKEEILELYLNLAPYGGNLLGVEAAARAYYGKDPSELTLAEAALVAGLSQSPTRLRPDRHPERARRRRDHVLRRMRICGFISSTEMQRALGEAVRVKRRDFPFEAPHFARMLRRRHPTRRRLRSTLDRRMQATCREEVRAGVDRLRPVGVTNGAAVLVENETGAVRALVGSCDFFSFDDEGQVNGALAVRSPGSALKPFTYALAMERGICTPSTVVGDVPMPFRDYRPENYDQEFRGPVSVRRALRESLNIPALKMLHRVGQRRLYNLLRETGLSTLDHGPEYYGLALTLGSADVRLLDLTNAYAALARLGWYKPVRMLREDDVAAAARARQGLAGTRSKRLELLSRFGRATRRSRGRGVLGAGACYLIADVLSGPEMTERLGLVRARSRPLRVAWKTGTSYGHRDAWTFAWTPQFTLGVWVGNFRGEPSKALVGAEAAAPIAAGIMDRLYAERAGSWYERPPSVQKREVCAVSGKPAGPNCPETKEAFCVRGRSDGSVCDVHVRVAINPETGKRVLSGGAGEKGGMVLREDWPAEVAAWFRRHGEGARLAPPYAPGAGAVPTSEAPRITSPVDGEQYVLLRDAGAADQKLTLSATASGPVYWFVGGRFLAATAPGENPVWELERGTHRIACSNRGGAADSVTITVR